MTTAKDSQSDKKTEKTPENPANEEKTSSIYPALSGPEEFGSVKRSLLNRLRQELPQLSPAERHIGEFVLEQPRLALRLPMDQLAKEIGVSQGTLSNFSQSLGYNGFKAFRLDLAAEVNSPINLDHSSISRGDSLPGIVNKILSAHIEALFTTLKSLELSELEKAIEAIRQARRIELYGLGVSATVAHNAFNRFQAAGLMANWLPDFSQQVVSAVLVTNQDVAIAFSSSGETKDIVKALSLAHQHGATTIAITSNPHSTLTRYADIRLVVTPREPVPFIRSLRISSSAAMHAIVDIIFMGIINSYDDAGFERFEKVYRIFYESNEQKG